jgi:hypothetical protein
MACGAGYSAAGNGPPDYAPAHGYRYRQGHVVYLYDERVGAYRVAHYHNVYYDHGRYYRWNGDGWYDTTHLSGGWKPVVGHSVPEGLARKHTTYHQAGEHAGKTTPYKKNHGKHGE